MIFVQSSPIKSSVTVASAGTTSVNATYSYRGELNGKALYNKVGQPTSTFQNAIYWDGGQWNISGTPFVYYLSAEAVGYPWMVVSWTVAAGDSPAPTVTQA